jgi:uncharacterized membrane protein YphA (DoxX/SURF4 family)
VEVLGSLALIFGFFGRIAALGVIGLMGVAAWKTMAMQIAGGGAITAEVVKTWWYDNPQIQTTYGAFHILAVAVGLALLIRGSGALSFDRAMSKDPA